MEENMDYQTKTQKIKELLELLYKGEVATEAHLMLSSNEYFLIIREAKNRGYIDANIVDTKTGTFINGEITITEKGAEFVHPIKGTEGISGIQFNIQNGDFRGASLGTGNTVNNNWTSSLEQLKEYINGLGTEEQEIGNELIATIETNEVKPGLLSKFVDFLEKHPHVVSYVGNALVWTLANGNIG